jgi:raffinose/stachyose/melibiose transport system permease protein
VTVRQVADGSGEPTPEVAKHSQSTNIRHAKVSHRRRRTTLVQVARFALVAGVACIWMVPIVAIVFTSLKTQGEVFTGSALQLPVKPALTNFPAAWNTATLGEFGFRSLMITLVKVPVGLICSTMAAFAFSRYRFGWVRPLYFVVIAGSMIPLQIALIPLFGMLLDLHLLNTYLGLFLVFQAFGIPFEVLLLTAFFNQVPRAFDEAARLDGASAFGVLFRVILPLSLPILAAVFIFDFIGTFNELSISLVVLQTNDMWTVPLGMLSFQNGYGNNYTLVSAAVIMSSVPSIIVYVLFQRYFVSGLAQGGLHG